MGTRRRSGAFFLSRAKLLATRSAIFAATLLTGLAVPAGAQIRTDVEGVAQPSPASGAVGGVDEAVTEAETGAPMVRELLCRGRSSGLPFRVTSNPSPRYEGHVEMRFDYAPSDVPFGADYEGLPSGSCSWDPWGDPAAPAEPGYILFDTPADAQEGLLQAQALDGSARTRDESATAAARFPDTLSIPRYMSVTDHYWVFYVMDQGPQVALSHGPWGPSVAEQIAGRGIDETSALPTTREAPTPTGTRPIDEGTPPVFREQPDVLGTERIGEQRPDTTTDITARWRIRDVEVEPALGGVTLRFKGGPELPTVTMGTGRPIRDPRHGYLFFEDPMPVGISLVGREGSAWKYETTIEGLPRGMTFNFLIDTTGKDGVSRADQHIGSFRTLTRVARIVFELLDIRNDGDHGVALDGNDDGEIWFKFVAISGDTAETRRLGKRDYSTGDRVALSSELSFELSGAEDVLRVVVLGHEDDDRGVFGSFGETIDPRQGAQIWDISSSPSAGSNFARGEFDLSAIAGSSGTIPFVLRSHPNGDDVSFDVSGYIEVVVE